jgi:hypothetical protein
MVLQQGDETNASRPQHSSLAQMKVALALSRLLSLRTALWQMCVVYASTNRAQYANNFVLLSSHVLRTDNKENMFVPLF